MEEAIEKLEQKRSEWRERVEYHRRKGMEFHVKGEYGKRDEEQQLGKLAIDTLHGLDYALAVLMEV